MTIFHYGRYTIDLTNKSEYMIQNTEKMFKLLEKYSLLNNLRLSVRYENNYVCFNYNIGIPYHIQYNIFSDRRETWESNGFTDFLSDKQYYNKQFINMIMTRESY